MGRRRRYALVEMPTGQYGRRADGAAGDGFLESVLLRIQAPRLRGDGGRLTSAARKPREVNGASELRAGGAASRSLPVSVLPGIEFAFAGHGDGEGPQRVQHLDGAGVLREHVGEPAVG